MKRDMIYWPTLLMIVHVIGLVLGVGAASVKVIFLLKTRSNPNLIPEFFDVSKIATPLIILGMILLTLSGIGWLIIGYAFTTALAIKLGLVLALWILGPYMDNVVEPKFQRLSLAYGSEVSSELMSVQKKYLTLEITATLLFYVIIIFWMLSL